MPKRKNNPAYVTKVECAEISGQIRNEISIIKKALVGEDLRGGLVKDVSSMKNDLKDMKKYINNQKTKGRDWRLLGFAVLGSVISGVIVAVITYAIHLFG